MATRKRRLILLCVVVVLIGAAGYLALSPLIGRQEDVLFRYKTARHTTATVVRKEHRENGQLSQQWFVYYRGTGFPIYDFHKSKAGHWEQGSIDSNATRILDIAEQRRYQQSGDRETHVPQSQYDSFSVGGKLDVAYRLRADGESVEVIALQVVNR